MLWRLACTVPPGLRSWPRPKWKALLQRVDQVDINLPSRTFDAKRGLAQASQIDRRHRTAAPSPMPGRQVYLFRNWLPRKPKGQGRREWLSLVGRNGTCVRN